MKYVESFPVAINQNRTLSLFYAGVTISKSCFDKLQPLPKVVKTNTYRVNGAKVNSLGPIGMTTCTLNFPKNSTNNSLFVKI